MKVIGIKMPHMAMENKDGVRISNMKANSYRV
jgi:hypothetical protein